MANDIIQLLRLGRRIQTKRKTRGFRQNDFDKDFGLNRSYFGVIERARKILRSGSSARFAADFAARFPM
jgi:hypothetical protein